MTKVGLFGIGLDTYWAQFDGLLDNLKKYQEQINKLDQQRRDYIAKKIAEKPEDNTLDAAMLKIIREQASNKNYKFE